MAEEKEDIIRQIMAEEKADIIRQIIELIPTYISTHRAPAKKIEGWTSSERVLYKGIPIDITRNSDGSWSWQSQGQGAKGTERSRALAIDAAANYLDMLFEESEPVGAPCFFVFKDSFCGYAGPETECDKSFRRCRELHNEARYSGLPAKKRPYAYHWPPGGA
jgi:hypothetical protein